MKTFNQDPCNSTAFDFLGIRHPLNEQGEGQENGGRFVVQTNPMALPALPVWTPQLPQGPLFDRFCSQTADEPGLERLLQEATGDQQAPLEIYAIANRNKK